MAPAVTVTAPGPPASLSHGAETFVDAPLGCLLASGVRQASGREGLTWSTQTDGSGGACPRRTRSGSGRGKTGCPAVEKQGADSPGLPLGTLQPCPGICGFRYRGCGVVRTKQKPLAMEYVEVELELCVP